MGTPVGRKYIRYSYMDPLGVLFAVEGLGLIGFRFEGFSKP